jgi:hypothetical protein
MKKLFLVLLILLTSCATLPKENCTQDDIQFIILKGFSVEHKSCLDLDALSWKIEIRVCEDNKWKKSNLWSYWNGCRYKLWQDIEGSNELLYIGKFKTLDKMKEFLEITLPMTKVKSERMQIK